MYTEILFSFFISFWMIKWDQWTGSLRIELVPSRLEKSRWICWNNWWRSSNKTWVFTVYWLCMKKTRIKRSNRLNRKKKKESHPFKLEVSDFFDISRCPVSSKIIKTTHFKEVSQKLLAKNIDFGEIIDGPYMLIRALSIC